MKKKRLFIIIAILILLLMIILLPFVKAKSKEKSASQNASIPPNTKKPLYVNAEVVNYSLMSDKTVTTGNIIPSEEVDLAFETPGKITNIYFNEGEFVSKGTLLAKINDKPLLAQLQKLNAQLPLAQNRVFRQKTLLEKNAVSEEAYESVTTELEKLKADIELVKANIDLTNLYAPFDGVIGLRQVSEGAYVTSTTKIARLTNVSVLKIDFSVPESYSNEIKKGTKINFRLKDENGVTNTYEAVVFAIESTIDTETRTLKVRAVYNNPSRQMVPGRYTSVEIVRKEIPNAISIPSEALVPEMGRNIVFLYKNGKSEPSEIVTGIRTDSRIQAVGGLSVGDTVIVSAVMQLRKGLSVNINKID